MIPRSADHRLLLIGIRNFGIYLLRRLRHVQARLVQDTIYLLYFTDLIVGEPSTAQTDKVKSRITQRIPTRRHIRRHILPDTGTALYDHMSADMGELVHQHTTRKDRPIVDQYFARDLGRVTYNDIIR